MLLMKDFFSLQKPLPLLLLVGMSIILPVYAGGKNAFVAEEKQVVDDNNEAGLEQTIEYNFSPEDRARLRKALSDYAKNTDPEHVQIEQRRKAMRESVEARFDQCNHDADESLDREETTECLPQIARHFSYVDVDEDGVITLEELELAQAKLDERQKAAEAKLEAQRIKTVEAEIKSKGKAKVNKQALGTRKRPS
jgi:hypothetical protein